MKQVCLSVGISKAVYTKMSPWCTSQAPISCFICTTLNTKLIWWHGVIFSIAALKIAGHIFFQLATAAFWASKWRLGSFKGVRLELGLPGSNSSIVIISSNSVTLSSSSSLTEGSSSHFLLWDVQPLGISRWTTLPVVDLCVTLKDGNFSFI